MGRIDNSMRSMNRNDKDEIDELMEAANHYALAKIEQCITGEINELAKEGSLAEAGFRLVNQYLFPNLNLDEIEALNSLAHARRVCAAAVNTPRSGMTPEQAFRHERKTRASELAFVDARRRVLMSNIMGKVTPI